MTHIWKEVLREAAEAEGNARVYCDRRSAQCRDYITGVGVTKAIANAFSPY